MNSKASCFIRMWKKSYWTASKQTWLGVMKTETKYGPPENKRKALDIPGNALDQIFPNDGEIVFGPDEKAQHKKETEREC